VLITTPHYKKNHVAKEFLSQILSFTIHISSSIWSKDKLRKPEDDLREVETRRSTYKI